MEEKVHEYKPVTSSNEILNEIKYILETHKNVDENSNYTPIILDKNCTSLNHVYTCIINEKLKFETTKKAFKTVIEEKIEERFDDKCSCVFYGLNFDKNEISIGFDRNGYNYEEIVFAKYNDDVYLKSSESSYGEEIFRVLYGIISNAYNELIKFKNYNNETSYSIKSMNSNFIIDISNYGVGICDSADICPKFKLSKTSYDDAYTCECNSGIVLNTVKGIEDEILKYTFVRIEDCPSWMRTNLYEMRKNELEEQRQTKNSISNEKQKEKTNIKTKFLSLFKRTKK